MNHRKKPAELSVVRGIHQFGPDQKPGTPFKIFLDDARNPPLREEGWVVVRTVADGIDLMRKHGSLVTEVSFDNDLGPDPEGIEFLRWILDMDDFGVFPLLRKLIVHTGNMRRGREMIRMLRGCRFRVKRVYTRESIYPRASKDIRYVAPYQIRQKPRSANGGQY